MSTETIFYTQIVSLVAFVFTLFGLYRLLVAQKDAIIELLKERIAILEKQSAEIKTQSPDALVGALSSRIQAAVEEIERLKEDGEKHQDAITERESALETLQTQLSSLMRMIRETDLVCPDCNSPLSRRESYPIYGYIGGREVEADVEYLAYECGREVRDGVVDTPCGSLKPNVPPP